MIVLAGLMGAVFGAIVGLPAMRLKHLYLAIATLSFPDDFSVDHQFSGIFQPGADHPISRVFWFTGKLGRKEHYLFWYYVHSCGGGAFGIHGAQPPENPLWALPECRPGQ
jgi:branched-chain amino acid transport system permease protein